MKLDSRYSLPDLVRLAWALLITRVLFRPARMIRQPTRIRGFGNMRLGRNFTTGQYCRIEAADAPHGRPTLVFGDDVQINDRCHIAAVLEVSIGTNVLIASDVFITDHDHGEITRAAMDVAPAARELVYAPVTIGDNVWICEKVVILKGVTIGQGTIVAAGAVVTSSMPAYCVVGGIPARVLRSLA